MRCSRFLGLLGLLLTLRLTPAAAAESFFGLTNLWEIRLTLPAKHWAALTPKERSGSRFPAGEPRPPGPGAVERDYPWSTATFECAGQLLTNVAVRFKGNSSFNLSRNGLKRPFKIDFDRGAKGRTFFGHEELLLNNNLNDGAQFREALAYDAFRRAGLAAPRTAFARLFLTIPGERTNTFLGLYTVVEAIEGDFLKAHFGTKKGLLAKPERLPGLQYLGPDWSAYTNRYEPKTDVTSADAARFIALTRLVDQADDATFARELPRRVDLTQLLRFIAVNAVLANYDSFLSTGHNFYLFQPRGDGKAVFIPWDLNESFGGHPGAGPRRVQAEFSVLKPQTENLRVIGRVLANPDFATAYRREVAALLTNAFNSARLRADADRIAQVTQESVFAESARARAAFEESALGLTNRIAAADPRPDRVGEFRPAGPGLGMMRDDISFADWAQLRAENIAAELAGQRTGSPAPPMRGPGGPRPPGRPQLGGPGGLVPRPGDGEPPRRPPERSFEPR
jgi:spore coat protein CotH